MEDREDEIETEESDEPERPFVTEDELADLPVPGVQPRRGAKDPYRALPPNERDLLFAFFEKYNGNMAQMVLDPDCPFKAYSQVRWYAKQYHFRERYVAIRQKRAAEVASQLQDAKVMALERAMEILRPHVTFVRTKMGVQLFDREGHPLIMEQHPFYKELKTAWEIIKTELGEPTTVSKTDITSKGEAITSVKVTVVNGTGPASNGGVQPQPAEQETHQGESGGNGQQ